MLRLNDKLSGAAAQENLEVRKTERAAASAEAACRAQAVASCREAKLRDLNLGHTHLPDASPAHLEGLTGLTELNLENTEVSHPGVEGLQHFLARVKVV